MLDRNPDNYFADVEQAAFDPAHFVPGIGPSPDKMLQGRLFAYGDAHRYRLGINHTQLPVNRPHAAGEAPTTVATASCASTTTAARPRTTSRTASTGRSQTGEPLYAPLATDGPSGTYEWEQPRGRRLRRRPARSTASWTRRRARDWWATSPAVSRRSRKDDIVERSLAHFAKADAEYGARVREALAKLRA